MPYIEIIPEESAEGPLAAAYADIIRRRGALSEVLMVQSLNPASIVRHLDLYMTVMFGQSPLGRARREMIAVVVSIANGCHYCTVHHSAALLHFWKDEARLARFQQAPATAGLSPDELALCTYARELTLDPAGADAARVERLRAAGLDERSILDATLVVGYFNFVNRMVMGLGVTLEEEAGAGFSYD